MTQDCHDWAVFHFWQHFFHTNSWGSSTQIDKKKYHFFCLLSFIRMFTSLIYQGEMHLDSCLFYTPIIIIIHYLVPHWSQAFLNFFLVYESNLFDFCVKYFINNRGVGHNRFNFLWLYKHHHFFLVATHKMLELVLEWGLPSHSSPPPP